MHANTRLDLVLWAPVSTPWLWTAGLGIGLVSGYATLELNALLAIPLAVVWLYVSLRRPRLVGLAGAVVGHGMAWTWLLGKASGFCLQSLPPICFSAPRLPFEPSYTRSEAALATQQQMGTAVGVVLLAVGIVLTVALALRLPRRWLHLR
jgi:hypothetical protein